MNEFKFSVCCGGHDWDLLVFAFSHLPLLYSHYAPYLLHYVTERYDLASHSNGFKKSNLTVALGSGGNNGL